MEYLIKNRVSCSSACLDINESLFNIDENEKHINNTLQNLLSRHCQIDSKMANIATGINKIKTIDKDAKYINSQIVHTAFLAESVSAKVRRLDLSRSRVSDCQQRVHDLIDLQLSRQGVVKALAEEEYEVGAGHISRFLAMDLQLIVQTADDVQGAENSVCEAIRTLELATNDIRNIVAFKFDEAVKKDNLANIERLFKIFPLIGRHQEGINKFSKYVCIKLKAKSERVLRNLLEVAKAEKRQQLAYADAITSVLENYARVIEVNQPVIEAFYGYGYLIEMFSLLQLQCDIDVKCLVNSFNINRKSESTKKKIEDVFLRYTNASTTGTSGVGHYRKASGGSDKLNPNDIDALTMEVSFMHSRVEFYFRFMRRRVNFDIEALGGDKNSRKKYTDKLNAIINKSDLRRQMHELLGTYLSFERFFMEESVIKAIALDDYECGQLCSSVVDDVFFILRKSIRRSLMSHSVNGTCAVINNAAACLENDFVNMLKQKLKAGYPFSYVDLSQAYYVIQNSLQGKLYPSESEKARLRFLVNLNNADVATEFVETLWKTMRQEIYGTYATITVVEKQLIESCLEELKSIRDALKTCVDFGLQQLSSSVIKPRLHPWVEQFLNYKHELTEDELVAYEAGETFVQFLIVNVEGLQNIFKQLLTQRNYDALISIVAAEITLRLERAIKKCTFNRLGGLLLDQEVRALGSYLAGTTSWSVRDKMTRLTQIATILNLERVSELNDYWNPNNSSGLTSWRLSHNEVKTILTLRSDFRMEDIKHVQL